MRAQPDAAVARALHRVQPALKIVSAIDVRKSCVVDGLETVFQRHEVSGCGFLQPCNLVFVYAVRSGADGDPDDIRMTHSSFIKRDEVLKRRVRICEGLKIDDESFGFIAPSEKFDPFPHLLRN
jgi:hypothetical protein